MWDALNGQTKFIIGCAFNPNALNFESQMKKLESKLAAGAQYVMTQPVFDLELARRTVPGSSRWACPFPRVMPLMSSRNAEFLHNEVPASRSPSRCANACASAPTSGRDAIGLEVARKSATWRSRRSTSLSHHAVLRYEVSVELLGSAVLLRRRRYVLSV